MSLIDPIQLMTIMGTTPERTQRATSRSDQDGFQRQLRSALGNTVDTSIIPELSGTPMENSLMHDALNSLASIMNPRSAVARTTAASRGGKHTNVGVLSAAFESGDQGVNAIGYDRTGGTSYGTYQIASKPGTMDRFIEFLKTKEPQWAAKLKAAGSANTGSKSGRMPEAWRSIANQNPERFGKLQREFIESTHYEPARDKILAKTGVDVDTLPKAAQEALWSTAVQHGPAGAANIFNKIIKSIDGQTEGATFAQKLINKVYDDRKLHFGSSTAAVQSSVAGRMNVEKQLVLAMLNDKDTQTA